MSDDTMAQSALSAWGDSGDEDDVDDDTDVSGDTTNTDQSSTHSTDSTGRNTGYNRGKDLTLYDDPSLDDDSCPWCLAPSSEFRDNDHNDKIGCSNCGGVIPVDADWYQDGRKQILGEVPLSGD